MSRAGFARKSPPSLWCKACRQPLAWHRTSTDVEVTAKATTITTILAMRDLSGVMFVCAVNFDTLLRGNIDAMRVEGRLET